MTDNLERRFFLGKIVDQKHFSNDQSLVEVAGIWYRYQIMDNLNYDSHAQYEVVDNAGNTLYLKQLK
ncbi:hypothetical protein [Apilactobacillus apinorum]|uniref:Uncharacterized protein n=1 Tax=Apilactobacillus apinorum TaxID=1218495 RepID=A0ABP9ZHT1_9LACO